MKPRPKPRKQSVKQKVAWQIGGAIGNLGCAQVNIQTISRRIKEAVDVASFESSLSLGNTADTQYVSMLLEANIVRSKLLDLQLAVDDLRYSLHKLKDLTFSQTKIKTPEGYDYE